MKIVWHGHSFFELECANGLNVVVDPFVENPLTKVKVEDLNPDIVLLTHGHGDHFGSAAEINRPVLAIFELANYAAQCGVSETIGMNIGGTYERDGVKFHMTDATHSGGVEMIGKANGYGGCPAGFIIDDGEQRVYHAGDTGLFGDMKTVIGELMKPTVALLPIGGYYTMGPEHAAIAVRWLGVKHVFPMHYNTFPVIEQDPQRFARLVGDVAKVHIPKPDEAVEI